ncbi:hypothetical protein HK099_002576, partial [Clydaea vesicula]
MSLDLLDFSNHFSQLGSKFQSQFISQFHDTELDLNKPNNDHSNNDSYHQFNDFDYLNFDDLISCNSDDKPSSSDLDSILNDFSSDSIDTNNDDNTNDNLSDNNLDSLYSSDLLFEDLKSNLDLDFSPHLNQSTITSPSEHITFALLNNNLSTKNIFRSNYINHTSILSSSPPPTNFISDLNQSNPVNSNNQKDILKKEPVTKLAIKIPSKKTINDFSFPQQPTPPYSPNNSSLFNNLYSPTNSIYSPNPLQSSSAAVPYFTTSNFNATSPFPSPTQERRFSFASSTASLPCSQSLQVLPLIPLPRKRKAIAQILISPEQQVMVDLLLQPNYTKNRINKKEKNFPCPCGKQFERLCGLKSHIKVHQSKKQSLGINEVSKNLEWTEENGSPISLVDEAETSRNFLCDSCPKRFLRKQDLRRHYQCTHSDSTKALKCPICTASFSRSDALHRHVQANR